MDRETPRPAVAPPASAPEVGAAGPSEAVEKRGWRTRLGRILPFVHGFARTLQGIGIVSAFSAVLIVGVVWYQGWLGVVASWFDAIVLGLLLMIPAGAAFLAAWSIRGLLQLPADLRQTAVETAGHLKSTRHKDQRSVGLLRSIWGLRKLVLDSRGALASVAGLARLARLPYALGLLVAVAFNGVVIGAAALVCLLAWMGAGG